jgi:hypothetical protein
VKLNLQRLDEDFWISPYGYKGALVPLPNRMRFLHPEAYVRLRGIAKRGAVFTDAFRSLAAQLEAVRTKQGVQQPGYSAHGFGLAVDVAVQQTMERLEIGSKEALDALMLSSRFQCYRGDHLLRAESWHYSFDADAPGSQAVGRTIQQYYGKCFDYNDKQAQVYLSRLKLYAGELDGKLGPQSKMAIRLFQRQWMIAESGFLNPRTRRLLAVANAEREAE